MCIAATLAPNPADDRSAGLSGITAMPYELTATKGPRSLSRIPKKTCVSREEPLFFGGGPKRAGIASDTWLV